MINNQFFVWRTIGELLFHAVEFDTLFIAMIQIDELFVVGKGGKSIIPI